MSQQRGSASRLIFDTETTYKTTPTPDAMVLNIVSESLRLSRNLVSSNTIRNDRNPQMPVRGNVDVAGDINLELSPQYGRLFYHIFGSATVTGTGSLYTWTYTIGKLPTGMVIEKQFTDVTPATYIQYNGCKVNSWRISVKPEGFIESSVAIIGAKETLATTTFDSTATDLGHTPFDGFGASITENGSSLAVVTAIDLTMEENLDPNTYVLDGTGERHSLPEGAVTVSGTLTALFENTTLYEKAVDTTETSLEIAFTRGTGAGTAGNEKLTVYVDECYLSPQTPVISGPTGLVVELPFQGFYNNASAASALRAILNCSVGTF